MAGVLSGHVSVVHAAGQGRELARNFDSEPEVNLTTECCSTSADCSGSTAVAPVPEVL